MKLDVYIPGKKEKQPLTPVAKWILFSVAFIVTFIALHVIFTVQFVPDESMEPSFSKGSVVLINKFKKYGAGNVIFVRSVLNKNAAYMKRIVAGSSSTVEINSKKIFVNGSELKMTWKIKYSDPRIVPQTLSNRDNMKGITLAPEEFFVMGDNIDQSFDSRDFGPVKKDDIIGIVIFSIL